MKRPRRNTAKATKKKKQEEPEIHFDTSAYEKQLFLQAVGNGHQAEEGLVPNRHVWEADPHEAVALETNKKKLEKKVALLELKLEQFEDKSALAKTEMHNIKDTILTDNDGAGDVKLTFEHRRYIGLLEESMEELENNASKTKEELDDALAELEAMKWENAPLLAAFEEEIRSYGSPDGEVVVKHMREDEDETYTAISNTISETGDSDSLLEESLSPPSGCAATPQEEWTTMRRDTFSWLCCAQGEFR